MLMILINNLIKFALPLAFFVWSIFQPAIASYVFIGIAGLFVAYLFFIDIAGKPNPDPSIWTTDEIVVLKKYHLSLRIPFAAKDLSCCLNGIRWLSIIWVPWLCYNHLWVPAIFLFVNFFLTTSISVRLDPFFFLAEGVRRGKHKLVFIEELALLRHVTEKLQELVEKQSQESDCELTNSSGTVPGKSMRDEVHV